MKIADIDVIPIHPRLAARYAGREVWFHGIDRRTVYRVRADNGLVGYGDHRLGGLSRASLQPLIGCDPFEFVNADLDPGLGGALYDLMGKALEVPAYRLMGPKVRDAVSVAAWTSRSSADDFGSEVERAAHQGYGVIKMHTAPFFDVLEQTRAAEDAAPPVERATQETTKTAKTPTDSMARARITSNNLASVRSLMFDSS